MFSPRSCHFPKHSVKTRDEDKGGKQSNLLILWELSRHKKNSLRRGIIYLNLTSSTRPVRLVPTPEKGHPHPLYFLLFPLKETIWPAVVQVVYKNQQSIKNILRFFAKKNRKETNRKIPTISVHLTMMIMTHWVKLQVRRKCVRKCGNW